MKRSSLRELFVSFRTFTIYTLVQNRSPQIFQNLQVRISVGLGSNKEGENRRIFHADSESLHMTTSLTWGKSASQPSITGITIISEELKLNWSRDQQFYHETPPPDLEFGFYFWEHMG